MGWRTVSTIHRSRVVKTIQTRRSVGEMAEYIAYFDDSGHPDDQEIVLVAGFLAPVKQWTLFESDWQRMLSRTGIDVFHMTDFEASKQLTRKEKDVILLQLVSLIRARSQFYICALVPMKDYIAINNIYAFEQFVGTPYALAARTVVAVANEWMQGNAPDGNVQFVFEDGTKHKGDFLDAMTRDGLTLPCFRTKNEAVPLQAADWFAWETFNSFKINHVRPSVGSLLRAIPGDAGVFYESDLQRMCEEMPVPEYSELLPGARIAYQPLLKKFRKRSIFSQ